MRRGHHPAALVALIFVLASCASVGGPDGDATGLERVHLEGRPSAVAVTEGQIWIADDEAKVVRSFDQETLESTGRPIRVGTNPVAVAVDSQALWVAHATGNVTRIDVAQREAEEIEVAGAGSFVGIVRSEAALWLADSERSEVLALDPRTHEVVSRIEVPEGAVRLAVRGDTLWVSNAESTVAPVDIEAERAGAPIEVGPGPIGLTVVGDEVWVAVSDRDEIVRIDADSGRVVGKPIEVGNAPIAVERGRGSVIAITQDDHSVTKLDPDTGRKVGRARDVETRPRSLFVMSNTAWIVGVDPSLLIEITL
ncbi:MAG: hypothetical protein WD646_01800 [Actinomycetota bacterium]